MYVFPLLTLTGGTGKSDPIRPYSSSGTQLGQPNGLSIISIGLVATVSSGASLTYSVEVTNDPSPSVNGNWNLHDTMQSLTSSANANIDYPVSAWRLSIDSYTSGTVTLGTAQWP